LIQQTSAKPHRRLALSAFLLAAPLAACVGVPTRPDSPGAATQRSRTGPADEPAPLDTERRWLQQWFEGTPVTIALQRDGALSVAVPREFCFDSGRHAVKPALAAVLDKVAESLRRQRVARLDQLAVPDDAPANAALVRRRGTAVRQHLLGRGVPEARLAAATAATAPALQLRIVMPPAP
jgi:outer membrane protein OmpA-like peptidoglycan-associated protein